tara:strand:+ start:7614 stop:8255 length:642 start_codon:yes stop_codon:yes gene_type:complete
MKVNVVKDGKKKNYTIINNWKDVTLDKWIKLLKLKNLTPTQEAIENIALLSSMSKKLIKELSLVDVTLIMQQLKDIENTSATRFKNIITIDGKDYGFHPNFEQLTLGEWADLETFIQQDLQNNLPKICAILYRPIKEKGKNAYIIEAYDGSIDVRAEKFKRMKAEQVQQALVFFWTFVSVLSKITVSYLTETIQKIQNQLKQKHLQVNGGTLA